MLLFRLLSRTFSLVTLVTNSIFCFSQQIQQPIVPRDSINLVADTIAITLNEAEAYFMKNNYGVLAQQYGVDAQKSLVRQAKLFNNPTIYYEHSIYNQLSKQCFPTSWDKWGSLKHKENMLYKPNGLYR